MSTIRIKNHVFVKSNIASLYVTSGAPGIMVKHAGGYETFVSCETYNNANSSLRKAEEDLN